MSPEDGAKALTKFYIKFGQGRALFLRYDINSNPCEAPTPLHCSLFTLTSPAKAQTPSRRLAVVTDFCGFFGGSKFSRIRAPFCLLRRHFPCQGNHPRPTPFAINFNPCEAPTPLHSSLFTLTSPARAVPTNFTVGHYISTVNTA